MAETFAPGSSFAGTGDTSYQNMWGGYSNATPGGWQTGGQQWSPWFQQGPIQGVNPGSGASNASDMANYWSGNPQSQQNSWSGWFPQGNVGGVNPGSGAPNVLALLAQYFGLGQGQAGQLQPDSYQSLIGGTPPSSPPPPPPEQQFPYQSPTGPQQQVSSANQMQMANMAPFLRQNYLNMNQYNEPGQSGFHGYY